VPERCGPEEKEKQMKLATITAIAALAVTALAGSASAAQSAAKPGFLPGKWVVTGKISGTTGDGPLSEVWSGNVRLTLVVAKNLTAGGSGTWALTMKGSGPVGSTLTGSAALKVSGPATDVRFTGTQQISGMVSDGVHSTALNFTRPVTGHLVITRAGSCSVNGTTPMGGGLKLTWSAQLAGSGTCNA
jgi:hypothetical protein